MSEKRDHLAKMYEDTTLGVTKSLTNWTDFLTVVGNLYKYPYHEQLMIYAQKPKATACAEFGLWNNTMNRFVKRGTSGIALIDPSTDKGQIKYVFDVADTGGKENARKPYLWEMKEHHEKPILDMLISKYEVNGDDIQSVIDKIANKLATEYYNDSGYSISQMVEDSFLEELDEYNVKVTFREAVSVSISYTLMKRMGIDVTDHFEHEDFLPIFDFNTPATISLLGTAVSEQTEQVFREIAKTILKEERNLQYEQSNLQDRGRISNPEHSDAGARELPSRQIREDEKSTSNGTPQATVQPPITEREVIPSSSGDRQDSGQSHGTVDERPREEATITEQNDPSNGMGSTSEQPTSTSRGNDFIGVNIQLAPRPTLDDIIIDEETQPQQMTLFPTEEQQIKSIADRQSAKAQSQSAISILTRQKADKLARCMEDFFNGIDTKYKGTIIADMPEMKPWDNISSKKKNLSLSFTSPVADMRDNAFTYFNRTDKTDEIAMNEAIYNSPFLSQFKEDKDFSISFTPTNIYLFFHNFEDKTIDFSLAPNSDKIPIDTELKSSTPYFEGYKNIKNEYPNAIVLYPLGDFFEAFGDDARTMSDKFDLKGVSHRQLDDSGERTPMVGVPAFSLESYVERLRNDGHDVVVCNKENDEIKPHFMSKIEVDTAFFLNDEDLTGIVNDFILASDVTDQTLQHQTDIYKAFTMQSSHEDKLAVIKATYGNLDTSYVTEGGDYLEEVKSDTLGINFKRGGQPFSVTYEDMATRIETFIANGSYTNEKIKGLEPIMIAKSSLPSVLYALKAMPKSKTEPKQKKELQEVR